MHKAFKNLGLTLRLVRELRGLSQSAAARRAGIGKSQLSKYEIGKELPKLESLGKVLDVLSIDPFNFFYVMHLVDAGELRVSTEGRAEIGGDAGLGMVPPPLVIPGLMAPSTEEAMREAFTALQRLYTSVSAEALVARGLPQKN
jgi:transcriptional regulator with XRE-family HTH domain